MSTPKQTFTGSCHCGFIKYTIALPATTDKSDGDDDKNNDDLVVSRCNCTICFKQGFTSLRFDEKDFRLVSPKSEAELKDYRLPSGRDVHKYFCGTCGIHVFSRGRIEAGGQVHEFSTLNALTLDQPQEGLDLGKFKIQYWDGRNDNWAGGLKDSPWPGQIV
ncbi:uncharacterized protein PV06_05888 [Exophiala oligosperma]|uniref:CENP-V/GFA domain-containing protein n=2 Tax=Chaetothyriales TaxID=34395 RepID=A0A0D2AQT0_9EURO|nr:uncharacterized protein PV06_05888 [Exophiala oligosperma]KAJ9627548.1 hypothetical protein H2204_009587 [Knufia peltigerae]KIW42326.1 hypothetical protein PV06_05888 [Exophiala oligosperma]